MAGPRERQSPLVPATDLWVVLHFFRCEIGKQAVEAREGQPIRWVTPRQLAMLPFPPADTVLVERLATLAPSTTPMKNREERRP